MQTTNAARRTAAGIQPRDQLEALRDNLPLALQSQA